MSKTNSPLLKTSKDILTETKNNIPLSNVEFSKTWTFWESYIGKKTKLSYEEANKQIFKWNDLITFFQFWNKYPGNDAKNLFFDGTNVKYFFKEQYRINAMNIFQEGIKPMWEDEQNAGGKYLQLEYKIKKEEMQDFSKASSFQWKKLILCTMGQSLPGSEYINGVRFIDKTDFERGKIIMFRMEVWISKKMQKEKLDELVNYLKEQLGCELITVKDIK